MRIVADANIPQLTDAFADVAEVVTLPSGELDAAAVRDAELLFVRSTVKVGPALLEGSRVRFVATATIGIDHLDVAWLDARGIRWASAPGSNADSVVQWIACALLTTHERTGLDLLRTRVGIVGVGNVGGRVARLCRALGPEPLLCDPPRQRREGGPFVPLDALLAAVDLVTLHVPLERGGLNPTPHLLDARRLQATTARTIINASRGEVLDGAALEAALLAGKFDAALLDVFPDEPAPAPSLVAACALATPHIAGHSLDGKLNGTKRVYDAACAFLGRAPSWRPTLPPQSPVRLEVDGRSDEALLLDLLRARYRIEDDDAALRQIAALAVEARGPAFRRYRQSYRERRELTGTKVVLSSPRRRLAALLSALGASPSL